MQTDLWPAKNPFKGRSLGSIKPLRFPSSHQANERPIGLPWHHVLIAALTPMFIKHCLERILNVRARGSSPVQQSDPDSLAVGTLYAKHRPPSFIGDRQWLS